MSLPELDRRAAITTARYAALRRMPITDCPYDPAGDARSRALALLWVRIYRRTQSAGR
ncbi:Rmf/CrpP family protein [Nonomuraea sp. NPDC052129]|uniref:Rmf/CrpP family protein n=1 Tax=Nonomuraea sp. NPDC052129 TaxID=3154651 RepID=UPI00344579B1